MKGMVKIKTTNKHLINEDIKSEFVMLVTDSGIVKTSTKEALKLADENGVDLVAMNNSDIPTCKLIDYKKYLYNFEKKAKNNKRKATELKEIRMTNMIAEHDIGIKAKTASRIISEGDSVKITITFKGRMAKDVKNGIEMLNKFKSFVSEKYSVTKEPTIDNNKCYMILGKA